MTINYNVADRINWLFSPSYTSSNASNNDIACQDYKWIEVFSSDTEAGEIFDNSSGDVDNLYNVHNKITGGTDKVYYKGFLLAPGSIQNKTFVPDENLKNIDFHELFNRYCTCDVDDYNCDSWNVSCWGNGGVYCELFPENEYCQKYDQIIPDSLCE